jgi:hypothetical protein
MSEPAQNDFQQTMDLTSVPLDQVARLCRDAAGELSPADLADRPALRRAVERARETAGRAAEAWAGHGEQPPPLPLPPSDP